MDRHRLSSSELIATAGGLLLLISLFLPWYGTDSANRFANIDGERGTFSCWDVHPILRWLLLLAALAPVHPRLHHHPRAPAVLGARRADGRRRHRGAGLLLFNAFGARPGEPSSAINLEWGWFVALLGILLMLFGSAKRSSETERVRKPPGVI